MKTYRRIQNIRADPMDWGTFSKEKYGSVARHTPSNAKGYIIYGSVDCMGFSSNTWKSKAEFEAEWKEIKK
jgi:hypothetical protein